ERSCKDINFMNDDFALDNPFCTYYIGERASGKTRCLALDYHKEKEKLDEGHYLLPICLGITDKIVDEKDLILLILRSLYNENGKEFYTNEFHDSYEAIAESYYECLKSGEFVKKPILFIDNFDLVGAHVFSILEELYLADHPLDIESIRSEESIVPRFYATLSPIKEYLEWKLPFFQVSSFKKIVNSNDQGLREMLIKAFESERKQISPRVFEAILNKGGENTPVYLKMIVNRLGIMRHEDYSIIAKNGGGSEAIDDFQVKLIESLPTTSTFLALNIFETVRSINAVDSLFLDRLLVLFTSIAEPIKASEIIYFYRACKWDFKNYDFEMAIANLSSLIVSDTRGYRIHAFTDFQENFYANHQQELSKIRAELAPILETDSRSFFQIRGKILSLSNLPKGKARDKYFLSMLTDIDENRKLLYEHLSRKIINDKAFSFIDFLTPIIESNRVSFVRELLYSTISSVFSLADYENYYDSLQEYVRCSLLDLFKGDDSKINDNNQALFTYSVLISYYMMFICLIKLNRYNELEPLLKEVKDIVDRIEDEDLKKEFLGDLEAIESQYFLYLHSYILMKKYHVYSHSDRYLNTYLDRILNNEITIGSEKVSPLLSNFFDKNLLFKDGLTPNQIELATSLLDPEYFENIEPLYNMIEDISPIRTPLELRYYFGQLGLLRYEDKAIRSFIKENSHNPEFALYYREYYSFIYRYGKECLNLSDKEVYEYSLSSLRVLYLGLNRYHFPRLAMSFLDELDAHYEILEKLDCSKKIAELDASLSRYLKQIIQHLAQNNKENNLINLFSFLGKSLNLLKRLNKYSRAQYAEVFYLLRK
ncbi:MAG: hypothetical protein K5694_04050, partial [Bacilli bacterium]|nr:hypothetical protein [Bacilli bacterium]